MVGTYRDYEDPNLTKVEEQLLKDNNVHYKKVVVRD